MPEYEWLDEHANPTERDLLDMLRRRGILPELVGEATRMSVDEIVSLRTALRFLRHGDDPAERRRLAAILALCVIFLVGLGLASYFVTTSVLTAVLT